MTSTPRIMFLEIYSSSFRSEAFSGEANLFPVASLISKALHEISSLHRGDSIVVI